MRKLLTIDYSSTSAGWSLWDEEARKPLEYGLIHPMKVPKGVKWNALENTLFRLESTAKQFVELVDRLKPDRIVIEEINRGISRLGQKTLDGGHFILYQALKNHLSRVSMRDSDGKTGWRTILRLTLTEGDKALNKQNKALNKRRPKGSPKFPEVTKKTLACRLVNKVLGTSFDVDARVSDADIVDALGLGLATLYGGVPNA